MSDQIPFEFVTDKNRDVLRAVVVSLTSILLAASRDTFDARYAVRNAEALFVELETRGYIETILKAELS